MFIMISGCQAGISLFKVSNENPRTMSEICSKLTINDMSSVFFINFEQILGIALVFELLTLNK